MTDDSPERELDADDLVESHSRAVQTNREGHSSVSEDVSSSTEVRTSHKTPRREVRWKLDKSANKRSLESIVRRFEAYLDCVSAPSADSPLRRITASPHRFVSHRCPGYLREEITLTADVSKSVVIAHQYPSQSEICTICGQLVQYPSNPVPHHTTKRRRQPPLKISIPAPSIRSYVPQLFSPQSWANSQREFDYLRSLYSYVPDQFLLFLVVADPLLGAGATGAPLISFPSPQVAQNPRRATTPFIAPFSDSFSDEEDDWLPRETIPPSGEPIIHVPGRHTPGLFSPLSPADLHCEFCLFPKRSVAHTFYLILVPALGAGATGAPLTSFPSPQVAQNPRRAATPFIAPFSDSFSDEEDDWLPRETMPPSGEPVIHVPGRHSPGLFGPLSPADLHCEF